MVDFIQAFDENFHLDLTHSELLYFKIENYLQPKRRIFIDRKSLKQHLVIALE